MCVYADEHGECMCLCAGVCVRMVYHAHIKIHILPFLR